MADATRQFFDGLAARGHEPLLQSLSGTIGFDLAAGDDVEHRLVSVQDGDVTVSRRRAKADCVVTADTGLFDRLVTGEVNAVAAALRGELHIEGQTALVLAFQRLFPGPPGSAEGRAAAGGGDRG